MRMLLCALVVAAACSDNNAQVGDKCDPKVLVLRYGQCGQSLTCDALTRRCVQFVSCARDEDCPNGEACSQGDSYNPAPHCWTHCWNLNSNVGSDVYCRAGYRCDDATAACVPATGCDGGADGGC